MTNLKLLPVILGVDHVQCFTTECVPLDVIRLVYSFRADVAYQVRSKTKQQCEQHYNRWYIENHEGPLPGKFEVGGGG